MAECDWGTCALDAETHVNLPFASPAVCAEHENVIHDYWIGELA